MFDQQLSVTEPQGLLSIFQRHGENFQLTDLWKKNTVNQATVKYFLLKNAHRRGEWVNTKQI